MTAHGTAAGPPERNGLKLRRRGTPRGCEGKIRGLAGTRARWAAGGGTRASHTSLDWTRLLMFLSISTAPCKTSAA